jgi:hypothetical protein
VPSPPPRPIVAFVDNTRIDVDLSISPDDGGSGITSYHLYIDEGLFGDEFQEVPSYDGSASQYTLTAGDVIGSITLTVG